MSTPHSDCHVVLKINSILRQKQTKLLYLTQGLSLKIRARSLSNSPSATLSIDYEDKNKKNQLLLYVIKFLFVVRTNKALSNFLSLVWLKSNCHEPNLIFLLDFMWPCCYTMGKDGPSKERPRSDQV